MFSTSDRVEIVSENQFKLLERIDRVAKIEGKRVSLSAMEKELEKTGYVDRAHVIIKTDMRVSAYVAIKLNKTGLNLLEASGKKQLATKLKNSLRHSFEATVLPRKWRFVTEFPIDAQGKVTHKGLISLFEKQ
jgi:acyl-coenzyme A synthetase/AMP-(fatty) acid ligase